MNTQKVTRKIFSITIKRMLDDSPDTSWLGEYSDTRTSDYSIDRAHSEDCQSITGKEAIERLEHAISYLNAAGVLGINNPNGTEWESLDSVRLWDCLTCLHS